MSFVPPPSKHGARLLSSPQLLPDLCNLYSIGRCALFQLIAEAKETQPMPVSEGPSDPRNYNFRPSLKPSGIGAIGR